MPNILFLLVDFKFFYFYSTVSPVFTCLSLFVLFCSLFSALLWFCFLLFCFLFFLSSMFAARSRDERDSSPSPPPTPSWKPTGVATNQRRIRSVEKKTKTTNIKRLQRWVSFCDGLNWTQITRWLRKVYNWLLKLWTMKTISRLKQMILCDISQGNHPPSPRAG